MLMSVQQMLFIKRTVTCSVKSKDLKWFENVLKSSRNDSTIRHIFVQGHVPIQHPVRKTRSSGQFFDEGVDSKFWKLMEKYEVDIYFGVRTIFQRYFIFASFLIIGFYFSEIHSHRAKFIPTL